MPSQTEGFKKSPSFDPAPLLLAWTGLPQRSQVVLVLISRNMQVDFIVVEEPKVGDEEFKVKTEVPALVALESSR